MTVIAYDILDVSWQILSNIWPASVLCTEVMLFTLFVEYLQWKCNQTCMAQSRHADITATIRNLKSPLSSIIEPDFGLLDRLLSLGVLSRRQLAKVRLGDKTVYERSDALLDLLVTDDQCNKFLKALQLTHQQHVANLIMANGGMKVSSEEIYARNIMLKRTFRGLQHCCWQYRSIFIRLAVVTSQICEIFRKLELVSVPGHPRSSMEST